MDYAASQFWFNVVMGVAQFALWLYIWRSNRDKATNSKISNMEDKFDEAITDLRVGMGHVDERLKKAIGHPELEPMHRRMNNIDKQMSEMTGEFKGVKHILEMIHQHMLNGGPKA